MKALQFQLSKLQQFDGLALAAWLSVGLLLLVQFPNQSPFNPQTVWPVSTTGLASCLALSELRRRRAEKKVNVLQAESTTDPLTGVGNRRWLDIEIKQRVAQLRRQNAPFSTLLVDIDHFKAINDRLGHDAGDAVLVAVAKELRNTLRDMDVICRIGGEEFVIVLPGTNADAAALASERLRTAIESASFPFHNKIIPVTVSIGVTAACASDTKETMLKRADEALYAAKRSGRNRCFIMDSTSSRCDHVLDKQRSRATLSCAQAAIPCPNLC
ncbi:MAG: GGDEF domain-containing protein [Pirellula sp.]|nr:GGDEF domain-containing protein [Pirellula sp.]